MFCVLFSSRGKKYNRLVRMVFENGQPLLRVSPFTNLEEAKVIDLKTKNSGWRSVTFLRPAESGDWA